MTADDQPTPRVGDTITTAAGLDALPVGSVVLDRFGDEATRQPTRLWAYPETAHQTSAYLAKHFAPLEVLHLPGAPQPAPTTDAVERAARERMQRIAGWQYLVKHAGLSAEWMDRVLGALAHAALGAARVADYGPYRGGGDEPGPDETTCSRCGHLAIEHGGEAWSECPTEVEWAIRFGLTSNPIRFDEDGAALTEKAGRREVSENPGAVLMQRDVHRSEWREVQL